MRSNAADFDRRHRRRWCGQAGKILSGCLGRHPVLVDRGEITQGCEKFRYQQQDEQGGGGGGDIMMQQSGEPDDN